MMKLFTGRETKKHAKITKHAKKSIPVWRVSQSGRCPIDHEIALMQRSFRVFRSFSPILILILCSIQGGSQQSPAPIYEEAKEIGRIINPAISEVSGITPCHAAADLWWVHNDSGDQARLYLIDSKGELKGRFAVAGARNRDWEDIASGPGRDGRPALYIADMGDNSLNRDDLTMYRVSEPRVSPDKLNSAATETTETAEAFPFRYPDGRHNAEALFVDPETGRPYIVTKTMQPPGGVYRFPMPLQAGTPVVLEKLSGSAVDRLSRLLLVTGAAASPDGKRVVVRTYLSAFEIRRAATGGFETIFDSPVTDIKLPRERQGEAITYSVDGQSILTTSEAIPAPIYQLKRIGEK
jgi:hypothetical protein